MTLLLKDILILENFLIYHFYIIDFLNELINLRIKNKDENVYTKNVLEKVEFLLEENKRINNTLAKLIEVNEPEEI